MSSGRRPTRETKDLAILHNEPDVDAVAFGLSLMEEVPPFGGAELVLSSHGSDRTSHRFHRLERANDFVMDVSDSRRWLDLSGAPGRIAVDSQTLKLVGSASRSSAGAGLHDLTPRGAPIRWRQNQ
jgi:hypothetical protein